jgi:TPR repeat protein/DNA-directed RNA polymerase subunit RPC12/RpoP
MQNLVAKHQNVCDLVARTKQMPDIKFSCNHCGQNLEVEIAGAGMQIECPECGAQLVIPESESPTSTESVTDASPPLPPPQQPVESPQPTPPQEYSEEIKLLHKAAEQGDVESQGRLGFAYWQGDGVPQDYPEAVKWLTKAVEHGYDEPYLGLEARVRLGRAYFEGLGVPQDYLQATRWFAVAAEQGHALAQVHYCSACRQAGFAYRHGSGVPQSDDEAAKFFRWAAEEGDAESQTNLGIAYIEGRGVPQSDKDAVKWFSKAAKQGDDLAQFWLGTCYFSGRGVPQNYVEAYKWATLAAAQGGADPQKLQAELSAKLSPKQIAEGQRVAALQIIEESSSLDPKAEADQTRQAIRSEVRREVWRRDQGQCVRCGSRENLEYDHIIPVSKGGSSTARNIELLCETCNRSKSDSVQ